MSLPLYLRARNQYVRPRALQWQAAPRRLQEPALSSRTRQSRKQQSVLLIQETGSSDRIAQPRPCGFAAGRHKASPLSLKLVRRQAAARITKRVKALAANTLDAVGQRQTHATPLAATRTHKQKGSLGD